MEAVDREKDYEHEANVVKGKFCFDVAKIAFSALVVGELAMVWNDGISIRQVLLFLLGVTTMIIFAVIGNLYINR